MYIKQDLLVNLKNNHEQKSDVSIQKADMRSVDDDKISHEIIT